MSELNKLLIQDEVDDLILTSNFLDDLDTIIQSMAVEEDFDTVKADLYMLTDQIIVEKNRLDNSRKRLQKFVDEIK